MKARTGIQLAIIGVLVIGGIVVAEERGDAKAKAFCSRFTVGGDFNQAIEAVNESGAYHGAYERSGEKIVYVQYLGFPPFSAHICFIDSVGGKIIRLRPTHYQAY
jgi:hypothetical protein